MKWKKHEKWKEKMEMNKNDKQMERENGNEKKDKQMKRENGHEKKW